MVRLCLLLRLSGGCLIIARILSRMRLLLTRRRILPAVWVCRLDSMAEAVSVLDIVLVRRSSLLGGWWRPLCRVSIFLMDDGFGVDICTFKAGLFGDVESRVLPRNGVFGVTSMRAHHFMKSGYFVALAEFLDSFAYCLDVAGDIIALVYDTVGLPSR